MKPADLGLLRIPGLPTLSPDGSRAVVTVARPDLDEDEYVSQLWLVHIDGDEPPRQLTQGRSDAGPRFSPDGRFLAFVRKVKDGKPQLYVMPTDGGEPRQVTDHPLGAGPAQWRPDSGALAYCARVPEDGRYGTTEGVTPDKERPRRITTLEYRRDGVGFLTDRRPHVFVVDPFADEPEPVQVTAGDFDDSDVTWSPDGSLLAFISRRHENAELDMRSDVFVCRPDGSDLHRITDTTLDAGQPAYSPDGQTVFFVAEDLGPTGRDFAGRNRGLFAVPSDGSGKSRRLTDAEEFNSGDGTGRTVVTPDGVLFGNERRGSIELLRVPFDGGPVTSLLDGPRMVTAFDAAAGTVVATVADGGNAGELVALQDGKERVLTDFGAAMTAGADLFTPQELTATAPDGYPVHGWLVRPAGDGPHPVLLLIHGGPFSQYGWTLLDEAQVYAGAGYAVVMGNPRGSSGYGEVHGRAVRGDVGERSAADLLALLDRALQQPGLDADRVGVHGGSHGGFMTSWLVGHTDRFRAGISERAVNAIDSFTGSSDIGWFFGDEMYGADAEQQRRQSPLTYVDQINTPLLIVHSEQDWRCPVEQAQRLFVALKLRGVETELLLFPGEGHELSRSGLPSHRLARFDAILDWWSRHLH
ncbi:MAG TPA: S9 family peptidase [Mycobacteriales bacterium]|jgi:dipeptidyl aminopeptidase/acylaminoacyl peptidase